jgi:hypothetical protein
LERHVRTLEWTNPLLSAWEKGARGMRGKRALESRKSLIAPKKSTLERKGVGDEGQTRTRMQKTHAAFMCKKRYNLVAASICISEKKRV